MWSEAPGATSTSTAPSMSRKPTLMLPRKTTLDLAVIDTLLGFRMRFCSARKSYVDSDGSVLMWRGEPKHVRQAASTGCSSEGSPSMALQA